MEKILPAVAGVLCTALMIIIAGTGYPAGESITDHNIMLQSDQDRYGLHGKLTAIEGKRDELAAILLQAAEVVSTAEGCRLYIVSKDTEDGDSIWITEVWDSREDHANSLKMEEVRELIAKGMPLISEPPNEGMELDVLGGWGLAGE